MAKTKLSARQKSALRKDLRVSLGTGTPRAEIRRTLAKRYRVREETIRWYMKQGENGQTEFPAPEGLRAVPTETTAPVKEGERRARPVKEAARNVESRRGRRHEEPERTSHAVRVADILRAYSEKELRQMLVAKKLLSRWQSEVDRVRRLRQQIKRVGLLRKQLRRAEARAERLRRELARLTNI